MTDPDPPSTFSGRARRYARVGATVGGLAVRLGAERYLGVPLDRTRHAVALRDALGTLKGPLMKAAQLLSVLPDAVPREYAEAFTTLQAGAPAMGPLFVKRRMVRELGPDWPSRFRSFDLNAVAAASLGQVHRAQGLDGRPLACKLQYPDMESAVAADLTQLDLVFALYRRYDPAIDTRNIRAELAARLHEELDYHREARHALLYQKILGPIPSVRVPQIIAQLSTRRLLTMTWETGRSLLSFRAEKQAIRDQLAATVFCAWYLPFYRHGVLHGDPHPGNCIADDDGRLTLLDFGCIRLFSADFVAAVIDLYHALLRQDREQMVAAYARWGFRNLSTALIDALTRWAAFLYGPLLDDRVRPIQEGGDDGRAVAFGVAEALRAAGGVAPPREFVFMDRAALGLGSLAVHLDARLNWHRLFEGWIADFDRDRFARDQHQLLQACDLPLPE